MKRKTYSFFTFIFTLLLSLCCLISCQDEKKGEPKATVALATDTRVVITVEEANGAKLSDCMKALKKTENLTYEISSGMLISLNGTANEADYNPCWMLYTSDTELSNAEWGTLEYDGKTLRAASLGVEQLPVVDGGIYVWEYQGF